MTEVDASADKFSVYYPAAMCAAGGIVGAPIMLSLGGGRYLSTRDFNIRVERACGIRDLDELGDLDF